IAAKVWQLRAYAAQAAALVDDRATLEKLATDQEDNVREAAIDGLAKVAAHAADEIYASQLERGGYQVLRSAAAALKDSPRPPQTAVPALKDALARLIADGRD